jgi:hypothetical protein
MLLFSKEVGQEINPEESLCIQNNVLLMGTFTVPIFEAVLLVQSRLKFTDNLKLLTGQTEQESKRQTCVKILNIDFLYRKDHDENFSASINQCFRNLMKSRYNTTDIFKFRRWLTIIYSR